MADAATAKGRDPGFADILIAATANAHGLTLVTRNIKPFEHLDVAMQPPQAIADCLLVVCRLAIVPAPCRPMAGYAGEGALFL
jgi:hypothetical protein